MRGAFTGVVTAMALLCACSSDSRSLTIDLRTDYLPGFDFTRVETTVEIGGASRDAIPSGASATDDFVSGQRIAEFTGLPEGEAQVRVTIRNPDGDLLATRLTRVRLGSGTGLLVVISRECNGVSCPGATDAPDATECLNGQCVSPTCVVAESSSCGEVTCAEGASCTSSVGCVDAVCDGPACLQVARDERCDAGERCDPEFGCVALGPTDGGMPDGGDAGTRDPSLVAHWPCEAVVDLVLEDVTGHGHDGTCSTSLCPAILPGRVGMACEFVSEFPDSIVVPHHPAFDTRDAFTISVWLFPRAFNRVSAFAKPVGAGDLNSYQIVLEDDAGRASLEFRTTGDGAAADVLATANMALVGDWHHVAATWDGATKRLYVDGAQVSMAMAPDGIAVDESGLCIGCDVDATGRTSYFDGLIDELQFYDRALSPDEVASLAAIP